MLYVALIDFANISEVVADSIGGIGPSYGPGLFVIIGGAAIAGVGALRIPTTAQEPLPDKEPEAVNPDGNESAHRSVHDLERLHDLHASGALSDDEYQKAKNQLLGD